MKRLSSISTLRGFAFVMAFTAALTWTGCSGQPDESATTAQKKAATTATNVVDTGASAAATNRLAIKSVFVSDPEQGRDPFYPHLKKKQQAAAKANSPAGTPAAPAEPQKALVVQSVLGSGTRRVALVNDAVLEPGRWDTVTIASGQRWRVFCVRIDADMVVVRIEGRGDEEVELPTPRGTNR